MTTRMHGKATINQLKDEWQDLISTGRVDAAEARAVHETFTELHHLLSNAPNPERVAMEAPIADAVRYLMNSALQEVTED